MKKRLSNKARIFVQFSDNTIESFCVPLMLVSRLAPVVDASYPGWTYVWVEYRGERYSADRKELIHRFGGNTLVGDCPFCRNTEDSTVIQHLHTIETHAS